MPIYRFEDLTITQQNPALSSGLGETVKGDRMYFCHRIWATGTKADPHHHPCEQFIYILRGKQIFTIEGEVCHSRTRKRRSLDRNRRGGRGDLRQRHLLGP